MLPPRYLDAAYATHLGDGFLLELPVDPEAFDSGRNSLEAVTPRKHPYIFIDKNVSFLYCGDFQGNSVSGDSVPRTGYMNASTYRTKLTRSIQSRVARQLGLSRSHVCMVATGKRRSRSVEEALKREYARVEREVSRFERRGQRAAA